VRISLQVTLACLFTLLTLPPQSRADDSNAAKVDAVTWANMNQVMSGTSTTAPDALADPLKILTPQGLYVIIDVHELYTQAGTVSGVTQDEAFKNYLNFILAQPGVAGLMLGNQWSVLNPEDPNKNLPDVAYHWHALNDAFEAARAAGKTLQLTVSPGAHSPAWLFNKYLTSCDFLFDPSETAPAEPADCGFTRIFDDAEGTPDTKSIRRLPMPWNATYKAAWRTFLQQLKNHIHAQGADDLVVSINVAGPTKVSGEMMLPKALAPKLPKHYDTPTSAPTPSGPLPLDWNANAAWNCLFANHYGAAPASRANYLNSDRAFIEEWAAAIDTYGEVFSGLTLTVATANALPDFSKELAGTVTCNSGLTIAAPAPDHIPPPQAFVPDCGHDPLFPGDCAAEAAILAYFAEPSVGGPNAKATQEDALSASDDDVGSLLTLSNASVKWLSLTTAGGLATVSESVGGSTAAPVLSRMLGGLQFSGFAFNQSDTVTSAERIGCPHLACKLPPAPGIAYCAPPKGSGGGCSELSPLNVAPVEQALVNALQQYFAGTSAASAFGAPVTIMNNTVSVSNAPLNYLQVWFPDVEYAAGWGYCDRALIMAHTLPELKANAAKICAQFTPPAGMPKACITPLECKANAQLILATAGANIPTTPVALPLFGYNDPSKNAVCGCAAPYEARNAFVGDDVCVKKKAEERAATENADATSNFALDESRDGISYGACAAGLSPRQAYMGDYVCVTTKELDKIAAENAKGRSHSTCP